MRKWLFIMGVLLILALAGYGIYRWYKAKKADESTNDQYGETSGVGVGDATNGNIYGTSLAPTKPDASYMVSRVGAHFGQLTDFPVYGSNRTTVKRAAKLFCGAAKEFKNLSGYTGDRYARRRQACLTPFMQVYGYKCSSDCDTE